jgi:iron complex outermembrane receptor protein
MTARTLRHRFLSACSLSALAVIYPASALAAETAAEQAGGTASNQDILIIGNRYVSGIQPERELDQQGIESYGDSTIDELIAEVQGELGDDQQPLILVNGERVSGIDEIGSLPVEALENVKVLPRGSGVRAGGTTGQRVVSLTLKKKTRSATALVAHKLSTGGDWNAERGEAILTYIEGAKRLNVTFKVRDEDNLFERDRGIIQPEPSPPFALAGNVVGFPGTSGEIDPLLSAAAGQIVTVTPVPGIPNPTLADFTSNANDPARTDLGQFRTLRPATRNYDLIGTFAMRLAPWLTSTTALRLNRSNRLSERGLPSALFVLPATNPASPFSTDVGLAYYGPQPLNTRSRHNGGDAAVTLNGQLGRWTSHFNARHSESKDVTLTERRNGSGTIPLGDTVDPFEDDLSALILIRTDNAKARNVLNSATLSFSGPAMKLPAGDLQATVEGQIFDNKLRSSSTFSGVTDDRRFHRSQRSLRAAIDAPLISGPTGGNLSATAEAAINDFSDSGTLKDYALGLSWEALPQLRFHADFEKSETPPAIQVLGNPVVVTSGVRAFDPLIGETVDVTQITGGNPDLDPEKSRVWRVSGQATLVPRLNLQLTAEYTDTDERNFLSFLPDSSAAVMLAFPDRFIRDLSGTLTTIDLRPVNFDSHHEKRLRYGFSLSTNIAGGGRPAVRTAPARRPMRLQLNASHSIVFEDEITIRPGLDSVDLLKGGAIGIGGGRVRHQLDGTATLSTSGMGLRMGVNWRGKYTLDSRFGGVTDTIRFSPVMTVDLRAFAEVRRLLPRSDWARGMRLSLNVLNATNDRQEVRDSAGNTPLQYQPGYRDPLGRTVELELRKAF